MGILINFLLGIVQLSFLFISPQVLSEQSSSYLHIVRLDCYEDKRSVECGRWRGILSMLPTGACLNVINKSGEEISN